MIKSLLRWKKWSEGRWDGGKSDNPMIKFGGITKHGLFRKLGAVKCGLEDLWAQRKSHRLETEQSTHGTLRVRFMSWTSPLYPCLEKEFALHFPGKEVPLRVSDKGMSGSEPCFGKINNIKGRDRRESD